MPKTVVLDFDGVIHQHHNYNDTIDGPIIPGTKEAIQQLQQNYAVAVVTCRDVHTVSHWLNVKHGLRAMVDPDMTFGRWQRQDIILVTNRKIIASAYIDDRAIRFTYWQRTLTELHDIIGA